MKKLLKWFTLVEILIVIVIIGILIWALVPRMQSAQWRARDVARKNDLAQLQAAILVSFQDKGDWPNVAKAYDNAVDISTINSELLAAWMNWVPSDPLKANKFKGLWDGEWGDWQYRYMIVDSYWSPKWWFVLMAKTEVEWWSNRVACDEAVTSVTLTCPDASTDENICKAAHNDCWDSTNGVCLWESKTYDSTVNNLNWQLSVNGGTHPDVQNIKPCWRVTKDTSLGGKCVNNMNWSECKYSNESQLRYILID